jgi:hypothetical protein
MAHSTSMTLLHRVTEAGKRGCTYSDLFHSKVYNPETAIDRLKDKGYIVKKTSVRQPTGGAEARYFLTATPKGRVDHS